MMKLGAIMFNFEVHKNQISKLSKPGAEHVGGEENYPVA